MRNKIRNIIGLLFIVGVGLSIIFWPTPRRDAIARVEELDGVYREERDPSGRVVVAVIFVARPITDEDLRALKDIRPLHRLFLDGTRITDAGLAHLQEIDGLEWVSLCQTRVTDDGMVHLSKIPTLQSIHLRRTRVSDAGLEHLQGLPKLTYVTVEETRITKAGIAALQRATPTFKVTARDR